jgi:hypothetical protein
MLEYFYGERLMYRTYIPEIGRKALEALKEINRAGLRHGPTVSSGV